MILLLLIGADLYVQASSLNLREAADPKSKLVATASIGALCKELAPEGEWSKLECPAGIGFAKREMLAETQPSLSTLLATLADTKLPYEQRAQAGQRAYALDPKKVNEYQLREAFVFSEAQRLFAAMKKPKPTGSVDFPFSENTSDHQLVMNNAMNQELGEHWWFYGQDDKPSLGVSTLADNAAEVVLFTSSFKKARAQIYRTFVMPLPVAMYRLLNNGQGEALCSAEPLDRDAYKAKFCAAEMPEMSAVTAHSTCVLECGSTCSTCQQACGDTDRKSCTDACKAKVTLCVSACEGKAKASCR